MLLYWTPIKLHLFLTKLHFDFKTLFSPKLVTLLEMSIISAFITHTHMCARAHTHTHVRTHTHTHTASFKGNAKQDNRNVLICLLFTSEFTITHNNQ